MSDYQYFLSEKTQIDELIGKGFVITHVTENLSGALVDFILPDKAEKQQLHITTADARKYFSRYLLG
ncbi:hypothetical protein MHI18_00070 [Peribacillus sp. FSL H8-0477]|uniref:hypothetical protein n=1 Tax=Peribacillus sp. FSL H8-0477 TaxID=2921388 RepID=UPI0030F9FE6B